MKQFLNHGTAYFIYKYILLLLFWNESYAQDYCPTECLCSAIDLSINCRYQKLNETPDGIFLDVITLDLSHNRFTAIPRKLSEYSDLRRLNMSYNKVSQLNSTSLMGLSALEELDLSWNNIINWSNITHDALRPAPSLFKLYLSNNNLRAFPNFLNPIVSDTLETLVLINCSITSVTDDFVLNMPQLKTLTLSQNPIVAITSQIRSGSLLRLDISNCNIHRIQQDALIHMPALEELFMSKNDRMGQFNVMSNLTKLDLSLCNLRSIDTYRLPFLQEAYFSGNHIRVLSPNNFKNINMQVLDLSKNAISYIDVNAFVGLTNVRFIDLSENTVSTLDPLTFSKNKKLVELNLSRNYLTQVAQLKIENLLYLDVSVCEIISIEADNLRGMPNLDSLDLSRNLLASLPDGIASKKLKSLNLELCRIATINNATFTSLPSLTNLNLAGNRLTSGILPSFFPTVRRIRLDDNLWRCDCHSKDFRALYDWLSEGPQDPGQLRCFFPDISHKKSWTHACEMVWYGFAAGDQMWVYSLTIVIIISCLFCAALSIKRAYRAKQRRTEENRERLRAETRDRNRRISQTRAHEAREAARNAPDPRELQRPPSYAEAVRMPPLDASYSNLTGSRPSLSSSRQNVAGSNSDVSRRGGRRKSGSNKNRRKSTSEVQVQGGEDGASVVQETQSMLSVDLDDRTATTSALEPPPSTSTRNGAVPIEMHRLNSTSPLVESSL